MACRYIYKGKQFDSELALDDFLLQTDPLRPVLGDIVFSNEYTQKQLNQLNLLHTVMNDAKKLDELQKKAVQVWLEDGMTYDYQNPYIGVNRFISGLKNDAGKLLTPEFRAPSYWLNRLESWRAGNYTDKEMHLFFDDDESKKIVISETLTEDRVKKVVEDFEKAAKKDKIEDFIATKQSKYSPAENMMLDMMTKWYYSGRIGTELHLGLQLMYDQITADDGTKVYPIDTMNADKLYDYLKDKVNQKLVNDEQLKSLISYAKDLRIQLTNKFGEGLMFFPEIRISGETVKTKPGEPNKLIGIVDMFVIDKNGVCHILDYKTSDKEYDEFDDNKKLGFKYQLSFYKRMLEKYGMFFDNRPSSLCICPIKMNGFERTADGSYTYNGVEVGGPDYIRNIYGEIGNTPQIEQNINEFIPIQYRTNASAEDLILHTTDQMKEYFPTYTSQREFTNEDIAEMIKPSLEAGPDETTGNYTFKTRNGEKKITGKTEPELFNNVKQFLVNAVSYRQKLTESIKNDILTAQEEGLDEFNLPNIQHTDWENGGRTKWLRDKLVTYCNKDTWELIDYPPAEVFGVLLFKNRHTNQIDVVKVTPNNPVFEHHFGSKERTLLTGNFQADIELQKRSDSLALKAVNGNVELMETMIILNQLPELFAGDNAIIGQVSVINPLLNTGVSASNKELMYNFSELNKLATKKIENNFTNGTIKMASMYQIAYHTFKAILSMGVDEKGDYAKNGKWYRIKKRFDPYLSALDMMDELKDKELIIEKLTELRKDLEQYVQNSGSGNNQSLNIITHETYDILENPERVLYERVLAALAQLQDYNLRQQLTESNGISLKIDNPGNFESETLNLSTKVATQAYQRIRDEISNVAGEIRPLIEDFKKSMGYGWTQKNIIGNGANLYKLLTEIKEGDIYFLNPWDTSISIPGGEAGRKLLKYMLLRINKDRYPLKSEAELEAMRQSGAKEYFWMPLQAGDFGSNIKSMGFFKALKHKLRALSPKEIVRRADEIRRGLLGDEQNVGSTSENLFEIKNRFSKSATAESRDKMIEQYGLDYFDYNLENLFLAHTYAVSEQKNLQNIIPMIKASMLHLITQGQNINKEFEADEKYIMDYVKTKLKHETLSMTNDPTAQKVESYGREYINMIKRVASLAVLGFSPVSGLYQLLDGFWKDISLVIRKPDGTNAFTFKNFRAAFKYVYADMFHYSEEPTKCQLINEKFGINDMDMNSYIDKIKSDNSGLCNFTNLAFRFTSRPDFYNRMMIFTSSMLEDGTWDAYDVKDHKLVYNFKKDKRFSELAKGPREASSNKELYDKQYGYWLALAQQFVVEGAKNPDGTDFKIDKNHPTLPEAYTNQELEGMKSLSDKIYGYYSDEKKSMIHNLTMGGLWMQMRTFWSGKKNQYWLKGAPRLAGRYKQKVEIVTDENGNLKEQPWFVDKDGMPTIINTGVPLVLWEGQFLEGILNTLMEFANQAWETKDFRGTASELWNRDDDTGLAFRANMQQLAFDLVMLAIIGPIIGCLLGDWADDAEKDAKHSKDFAMSLYASMAMILSRSITTSFSDFNFIDSIGSPLAVWSPFSFEWTGKFLSNWWKVAMGDKDFWDGVVNSSSALKVTRPLWDSIKPDFMDYTDKK